MKIFTYPDAVLKATAEPVQNINEEIRNLVDNMCETMYSAMGIGLAANQVGELKRILVYDVNQMEAGPNPAVRHPYPCECRQSRREPCKL